MSSVTFPWPPSVLSPNSRPHWAVKAAAVKKYRRICWALALEAKMRVDWDGDVHLHIAFYPPSNRGFDQDGLISRMKAGLDGLADALGVDDSRFRLHSAVLPSRKGGAVVVALSRGV